MGLERDQKELTLKQRIEKKLENLEDNWGNQVEVFQCNSCLQYTEAQTAPELNVELQKLFQFVVCRQCLEAVHFCCLASNENQQIKETIDVDIRTQDGDTRTIKCMVYQCEVCTDPTLQERLCISCGKQAGNHVMRKVVTKEDNITPMRVHNVCAMILQPIYKIYDIDTMTYIIDKKYLQQHQQPWIIPQGQVRENKDGLVKFEQQCQFCNSSHGHLALCGENFKMYTYRETTKSPQKEQLKSCTVVVHPYCALINQKKRSFTTIRETEYLRYDDKGNLTVLQPQKVKDEYVKAQCNLWCKQHYDLTIDRLQIHCFNCHARDEHESMSMTYCDYCKIWYHDICIKQMEDLKSLSPYEQKIIVAKDEQQRLSSRKSKKDENKPKFYQCLLCVDTNQLLQGFAGQLLLSDDVQKCQDIVQFDFRSFKQQVKRQELCRRTLPTEIQLIIYTKLWLKVTEILKNQTTSESLLQYHLTSRHEFTINVEDQANELIALKKAQSTVLDQILQQTVVEDWVTQNFDILDANGVVVEHNKKRAQRVVEIVQPCCKQIKESGHLSTEAERIYINYLRCSMMLQAGELVGGKPREDQVTTILERMARLDISESNTWVKMNEIFQAYVSWKNGITQMFNVRNKSDQDFLNELKHKKQRSTQPVQAAVEFFISIFKLEQQQRSWDAINQALSSNQPQIDVTDFIKQTQDHAKYLQQLIDSEFPQDKPISHLKKRLCYLASQPFCPDVQKLIQQYKLMAEWQTQAKLYLKDFKQEDFARQGLKLYKHNSQAYPDENPQIKKDKGLLSLIQIKRHYVVQLQRQCVEALEAETDVDSLKSLIETCNKMGEELEHCVQQVKIKIDVMGKVLAAVGGAYEGKNFEDYLKQVMNEVVELKSQKISIPQDLESMLEAKVQISEELRNEFYSTLDRCADSYNKQMHLDLRRILQTATKSHNLLMENEKRIVENLNKSEEWFVQTFAKLKQMAGPALHQIDFKDYNQLYGVIKSAKDADALLTTKKNFVLVGAAQNLYNSLQGAKWLFEVFAFLDSNSTYVKELSQLLQLHYKAKELNLHVNQTLAMDNIVSDDVPSTANSVSEFQAMAEIAVEFDSLFGTHNKVIATLETNEYNLSGLSTVVDRLQMQLQLLKENKQLPINVCQELETLQKVRQYISLNDSYQRFISGDQAEDFIDTNPEHKISYQKAVKLQRQACENQIPEDIPVLKRLNFEVQKYEKFKRQNGEYQRFKQRIRTRGEQVLSQQGEDDHKFTLAFVERLLSDSQQLKIEIDQDMFDYDTTQQDKQNFEAWRESASNCLRKLEKEVVDGKEFSWEMFCDLKSQIRTLTCYDCDLFLRIQAFDWVLLCSNLLRGIKPNNQQVMNLNYWKNLYDQHKTFTSVLPILSDHPLLQNILNEINQTSMIIDFVNACRNTQKSLAGKFVQAQRSEQYDNCMAFKQKHSVEKMQRMIDVCSRLQPDVSQDVQELKQWVKQYLRYTQMCDDGSFWQQGYEKIKQILRTMFVSPINYDKIFFECERRLKIADEIRQDLKQVIDEYAERRIKLSRIETTLNHFDKNCQITQIQEVERLLNQIQMSRDTLEQCEQLVESDLNQAIKLYQTSIPIDLEMEEIPLKREIFNLQINLLKEKISYSQFHHLEKDYLKLKQQILRCGLDFSNEKFEELRAKVHTDLAIIKNDGMPDSNLIDYTQVICDYEACKYQKSIKRQEFDKIENIEQQVRSPNHSIHISGSDVSMISEESSEAVSNSQDSSDDEEGGEAELSENKFSQHSSDSEHTCLATSRARRQIKPNFVSDHIYFVKPAYQNNQGLTKSQIKHKREAKSAAKEFERQRQRALQIMQDRKKKQDLQPLDFNKPINIADDSEAMLSINKMKTQIRNRSKTQISFTLKKLSILGDVESAEVQKNIKQFTLELEQVVADKYPAVDDNYRRRITDTCDNIKCLMNYNEIAELFFTRNVLPLNRITQPQLNFKEQIQKMQAQRTKEHRQIPKQAMPQKRPQQSVPDIRPVQIEEVKRANSVSSVESVHSNPAQFSDDDGKYDPITSMASQRASFLNPPPGVYMGHFNYDPTLVTQPQKKDQKILYDPRLHGAAQSVGLPKTRPNQAKPGSVIKVFEGNFDVSVNQFQVTLLSQQDIKIYQRLPDISKHQSIQIKGKNGMKETCDYLLNVRRDVKQQPGTSTLLKGVGQRRSHYYGTESENYQKFFENLEQTQRVAVFTILENHSLYFVPVNKNTREFCQNMGVLNLTQNQPSQAFGQQEVFWFAWFCHIRRSSGFWNPTVVKYAKEEIVVKEVQKQLSPIMSEEPSYESTRKTVEINLIQPAGVKSEQNLQDPDEIDIDELIARFRQNGEFLNIEQIQATLQPIIHKFTGQGKKEEKLEAFLKEVIAKNNQMQVKQEMPQMQMPPHYYQRYAPVPGMFQGIRPPPPMPQQYPMPPYAMQPVPPHMLPTQQFRPPIRPPMQPPQPPYR